MKAIRLILMVCVCAVTLAAQGPTSPTGNIAIQIVTYLDLLPAQAELGRGLLVRQAQAQQALPGCLSARLWQEQNRPNHWMFVETWSDPTALDTYHATGIYLRFRTDLQSVLASPFDERRGRQIVP